MPSPAIIRALIVAIMFFEVFIHSNSFAQSTTPSVQKDTSLLSSTFFYSWNDTGWEKTPHTIATYAYDTAFKIVEHTLFNKNEKIKVRCIYEYNADGKTIYTTVRNVDTILYKQINICFPNYNHLSFLSTIDVEDSSYFTTTLNFFNDSDCTTIDSLFERQVFSEDTAYFHSYKMWKYFPTTVLGDGCSLSVVEDYYSRNSKDGWDISTWSDTTIIINRGDTTFFIVNGPDWEFTGKSFWINESDSKSKVTSWTITDKQKSSVDQGKSKTTSQYNAYNQESIRTDYTWDTTSNSWTPTIKYEFSYETIKASISVQRKQQSPFSIKLHNNTLCITNTSAQKIRAIRQLTLSGQTLYQQQFQSNNSPHNGIVIPLRSDTHQLTVLQVSTDKEVYIFKINGAFVRQ